ncbi:DUF1043 family protein [Halopseudomonas pachastrellae]|nr:DUF1043 family protein [Halopseudomonas pachastrellae]
MSRRVSGGTSGSAQAQLESLQLRFEEYQQEVATHFKTTATLASRLNRSYQDIQEHLTHGAMELAPDDMTRQRLLAALDQETGTVGESRNRKDPAFDSLEPPRDYAPQRSQRPGHLSEDFGINANPDATARVLIRRGPTPGPTPIPPSSIRQPTRQRFAPCRRLDIGQLQRLTRPAERPLQRP